MFAVEIAEVAKRFNVTNSNNSRMLCKSCRRTKMWCHAYQALSGDENKIFRPVAPKFAGALFVCSQVMKKSFQVYKVLALQELFLSIKDTLRTLTEASILLQNFHSHFPTLTNDENLNQQQNQGRDMTNSRHSSRT